MHIKKAAYEHPPTFEALFLTQLRAPHLLSFSVLLVYGCCCREDASSGHLETSSFATCVRAYFCAFAILFSILFWIIIYMRVCFRVVAVQ
jgi:hypothetical protein